MKFYKIRLLFFWILHHWISINSNIHQCNVQKRLLWSIRRAELKTVLYTPLETYKDQYYTCKS